MPPVILGARLFERRIKIIILAFRNWGTLVQWFIGSLVAPLDIFQNRGTADCTSQVVLPFQTRRMLNLFTATWVGRKQSLNI